MSELLFGELAPWFAVPAMVGTAFFTIRIVLMLTVGHGAAEFHVTDASAFDLDHGDSSGAFKILSLQAIAAFLMGFGWGGLGAYRGWGIPAVASVPVGAAVGLAMVWLLTRLLRWIAGLQSSGTLDPAAALYEEGRVYARVPAAGAGKGVVRVVVNDRLRYLPAVSDGPEIDSNTRVRVTAINEDNTVTVTRAEENTS